jgi:hypothetical protein
MRGQRPKRVARIGWFWVVAGAVKGITLPFYLRSLGSQLPDPQDIAVALSPAPSWLGQAILFASRHISAFAAFWVALAVFVVLAGASVLRGRSWARFGLELVCWFGLLEAPLVAAFLYLTGRTLSSSDLPAMDRLAAQVFRGIWACAAWLAIYVVGLVLLRGAVIRSWVTGAEVIRGEA